MDTLRIYASILKTCIKRGYRFLSYPELYSSSRDCDSPWLLLRHDIDLSPKYGVVLAQINRDHGISGTFFLQIDSVQYNLFDKTNMSYVKKIIEHSQHIGLHYSVPENDSDFDSFLDDIHYAFEALMKLFGACHKVVAWHNVSLMNQQFVDRANRVIEKHYLCTHNSPFSGSSVAYVSDALMRNSPREIKSKLLPDIAPHAQLNLHPVYWALQGQDVTEVFLKNIHERIIHAAKEHDLLDSWKNVSKSFYKLIDPLRKGMTKEE